MAVFAMLLARTLVTERPAAERGLVACTPSIDRRALREIAPVTIAAPAVVATPVLGDPIILASWYGPGV